MNTKIRLYNGKSSKTNLEKNKNLRNNQNYVLGNVERIRILNLNSYLKRHKVSNKLTVIKEIFNGLSTVFFLFLFGFLVLFFLLYFNTIFGAYYSILFLALVVGIFYFILNKYSKFRVLYINKNTILIKTKINSSKYYAPDFLWVGLQKENFGESTINNSDLLLYMNNNYILLKNNA